MRLYNEEGAIKQLKVATVAMECDREPAKNRAKIVNTVETIKQTNPDTEMIVFGEMILGWYNPGGDRAYHRGISEPIPGETTCELGELASKYGMYLCFGISEIKDGILYNTQVLLNPQGEIQAIHRKWNLKPGEKKAGYQPGPQPVTITEIKGIKVGMIICSDAANSRTMLRLMKEHLELIILSLADDKDEGWFMAKANARLYDAWIISANRYGREHDYWSGHLAITDPMGQIRSTSFDQERYLVYELRFPTEQSWLQKVVRGIVVKVPLVSHILKHRKTLLSYFR